MTNIEPTVDLGAVRWSTENRHDGWHLVAIEDQPDGYGEVTYDLRVERATDTNGADLSGAVAEALAQQVDGWILEIDCTERDAYARGFDAGVQARDRELTAGQTSQLPEPRYTDPHPEWIGPGWRVMLIDQHSRNDEVRFWHEAAQPLSDPVAFAHALLAAHATRGR